MAEYGQRGAAHSGVDAENYIFALDIGTRSIIGIVGIGQEELFRVVAVEMKEHPGRAMADGQIEDIHQVARTAAFVKKKLEERVGFSLTKVNVAAAGRALRTGQATFSLNVNNGEAITAAQIHELEMGAISLVREELDQSAGGALRFYCVGHSVSRYYLDDYPFSTILGHKGSVARADVIATFLPAEVVDSLCAAMALIDCEIRNLTLEPIAAMNAVIPAELRLLNLALVDIGAGTSDIALCDSGCVSGYTMATVAGDEITEEIIKKYLVDFQTAERMKHAAARGETEISYHDILGFEYKASLEELLDTLRPATALLSAEICSHILQSNGRPPAAVFLVGGGSLTPLLSDLVAEGLGLDRKKVAIGGNNFIKRVAVSDEDMSGPMFATPIGIALTAAANGPQSGFHVLINDKKIRLFRNDVMTVLDTLLLCGYQYSELLGRNGRNITYYLNGQKMILRGEHLQPAQIRLNDVEASVSAVVNSGDRIDFIPAVSGADAKLTLREIGKDPETFDILLSGTQVTVGMRVLVNGKPAQPGQQIQDLDVIETMEVYTLRDACELLGILPDDKIFSSEGVQRELDSPLYPRDDILVIATGTAEPVQPKQPEWPLRSRPVPAPVVPRAQPMAESQPVAVSQPVATPQPVVESQPVAVSQPMATPQPVVEPQPVAVPQPVVEPQTVTVPQPVATPQPVVEPQSAADPLPVPPTLSEAKPRDWGTSATQTELVQPLARVQQSMQVTLNDRPLTLPPKEDRMPYQFIDMLNLVDLDPTRPQGNIVLLLNGSSASYLDEVHSGDIVEIRWEGL